MSEQSYSKLIRTLSDNYSSNRISFEQYRAERKILLWRIDEEYNDIKVNSDVQSLEQPTELT